MLSQDWVEFAFKKLLLCFKKNHENGKGFYFLFFFSMYVKNLMVNVSSILTKCVQTLPPTQHQSENFKIKP
jgi:hypothetical protein